MLFRAPGKARPGLSLLEVIVSLAIFLMSMVAIGQIVSIASQRALDVQQRTIGLQIAQTKLAEVQAGAIPLENNEDQVVEEDNAYHWSVLAEQGQVEGLWNVTIKVVRERGDGTKVEVALSQMLMDPKLTGSTQDIPPAVLSSTTSAAQGSSSSSSGTPSSGTPSSSTPSSSTPAASPPSTSKGTSSGSKTGAKGS
jgi:general secretion pathway protein I